MFSISLSALLECLQLFGADAATGARGGRAGSVGLGGSGFGFGFGFGGAGGGGSAGGPGHIFDQQALLAAGGTCRLVYEGKGRPLCVMYVVHRFYYLVLLPSTHRVGELSITANTTLLVATQTRRPTHYNHYVPSHHLPATTHPGHPSSQGPPYFKAHHALLLAL